MENKVKELARQYGYNGWFASKTDLNELVNWATSIGNDDERRAATIAVMVAINTMAMMRAKEELGNE